MATVSGTDNQAACRKALSAINYAGLNGVLTDTNIAANATVTLLITAMGQAPMVAGLAPDAIGAMQRGLRIGNLAGAIPETTGVTTLATLRTLVSANTPDVSNPTTYTAEFPN
jgi:hypothetical protein